MLTLQDYLILAISLLAIFLSAWALRVVTHHKTLSFTILYHVFASSNLGNLRAMQIDNFYLEWLGKELVGEDTPYELKCNHLLITWPRKYYARRDEAIADGIAIAHAFFMTPKFIIRDATYKESWKDE